MTPKNSKFVSELRDLLGRECRLYLDYLEVIAKERASLVALKRDEIQAYTEKRIHLNAKVEEFHLKRQGILRSIAGKPDSSEIHLVETIEQYVEPAQRIELKVLADRLKSLIQQTQQKTRELEELTRFSLGIVNSTLSIISSASSPVTSVYSPSGKMAEKYQPPSGNYQPVARRV